MNTIFRYYRTIRYMKLCQIVWQIIYRLKRLKLNTNAQINYSLNQEANFDVSPIRNKKSYLGNNKFHFLNQTKVINDFSFNEADRLWIYNLHYFDYIFSDDSSFDYLINKWIKDCPVGSKNAWDPYTISLRVVNLIKYHFEKEKLSDFVLTSLKHQIVFLSRNVEYHILGNHILENFKSLTLGFYFFGEFNKYEKYLEKYKNELNEQVLKDGAHFELSPMYHAIVLEGVLDVVNFCKEDRFLREIRGIASRMISWLDYVSVTNGSILYFNDSTEGIAKSPEEIFEYAKRLNIKSSLKCTNNLVLGNSNIFKFEFANNRLFIKGGGVIANYIPGHSHADLLSFELYHDNQKIITNTGISTYNESSRRIYERGSSSHNTLCVKGENHFEVWKSFRVGRRTIPKIESVTNSYFEAETKENNFKRKIVVSSDSIVVNDSIYNNKKEMLSYIHFVPAVEILQERKDSYLINLNGRNLFNIRIKGSVETYLQDYLWCKGFNCKIKAKRIVILFMGGGDSYSATLF